MRSINGFNSDALQGSFAPGQPITASALNKLATAADAARTMMSNDVTFFANTDGVSYGLPQELVSIAQSYDHPFKVDITWSEDSAMFDATVTAGTINNIVPVVWGGSSISDLLTVVPKPLMGLATVQVPPGNIYFYIRSGMNPSTNAFPDSDRENAGYPQVWITGTAVEDSDDYGYILLAQANVTVSTKTVNWLSQFVTGSLWADRIKVGSMTARYYYSRV
jgi:hypothetical protein